MAGNTNHSNVSLQTTELDNIKAEFDGSCRIIKDLGEFAHVVTLQRSGQDIVYKFQMTGDDDWHILDFDITRQSDIVLSYRTLQYF
jgi:3-deoxy-D-arabino-heptulosonate 7-phosphate (DAHP) synthase class II